MQINFQPQNNNSNILPPNPMANYDSIVNGMTSDSHTQQQREQNMFSFKKKMDEYIDALNKQNNANRTAVYDLEDRLAQKEKELHDL